MSTPQIFIKPVLRAISEINACNDQFAPKLVVPFNTVIRGIVERLAK